MLGWKQSDLAAAAGAHPSSIKNLENDKAPTFVARSARAAFEQKGIRFLDEVVTAEGERCSDAVAMVRRDPWPGRPPGA